MDIFREDPGIEAATAAAEAEYVLRTSRPAQLSDAAKASSRARIAAYEEACAVLWRGLLVFAADWYRECVHRALHERRLVAPREVLDQVHAASVKAAARVHKQHADAAKGAPWCEAVAYFYPLRPGAPTPTVLDRLGKLVAEPLPAICALASLPPAIGVSPFDGASWPTWISEERTFEARSAGEGAGVAGADATSYAPPGAISTQVTERRAVPHQIHRYFVAVADAASRLSNADIAIALSADAR